MTWASKHPAETAAEWGAPLLLAAAAGWAMSAAGFPLAAIAAAAMIVMAAGVMAMRLAGRAAIAADAGFEPVEFSDCAAADELLLDDVLIEVAPGSRVSRLFAASEPTPGDLVVRIEDYLGDNRRAAVVEAAEQRPVDASAALHAALANIRSSLR